MLRAVTLESAFFYNAEFSAPWSFPWRARSPPNSGTGQNRRLTAPSRENLGTHRRDTGKQ
jgi:hypothetical protein